MKPLAKNWPARILGLFDKYKSPAIFVLALFIYTFSFGQRPDTVNLPPFNQSGSRGPVVDVTGRLRPPSDTFKLAVKDTGSIVTKKNPITGLYTAFVWTRLPSGKLKWDSLQGKGSTASVNLNSSRQSTQFAIKSSPTDSTIIQAADSLNGLAGAQTAAGKKKEQRQEPLISYAELRALTTYGAQVHYKALINKQFSDFYFDPASTQVDDSVMCVRPSNISIGNPGRYLRHYNNFIQAEWFEVHPDDGVDDSYGFQKAINFAIHYSTSAKVVYGGGVWNVKNLVIANYSSGNANYVTVELSGPCPAYDGQSISAKAAEFYTTDPTAPTLVIQRGANVTIRNTSFRGVAVAPAPGDISQLALFTDSNWNNGGIVRDNPVSPHGAIIIDAFHSGVTGGNRYPGLLSYYTNTTTTGSSKINIDGCAFQSYIVAIGVSMAPSCVNGDNIVVNNAYQYGNKVFWATGQAQTRDNSIIDLYSIGSVGKIIDGRTFGAQTGSAPSVWHSSFNGSTKYLYDANTNFETIKFIGCYAENLYSLGRSNGQFPVDFTNCNLNITTGSGSITFQSPVLAQGGPINFRGGVLAYFDNDRAQGFNFANDIVTFNGTTIQGGVPINWYPTTDLYGNISFDNVTYQNSETTSILKKGVFESPSDAYARTFVNPSLIFADRYNAKYYYRGQYFERLQTDSKKLHIDTAAHKGYFISANPSLYGLKDYITTATPVNFSNDIYNAAPTGLGWVYAISNDTIRIDYIPFGVDTTVTYDIQNTRIPRFLPRALVTTNVSSPVLTNLMVGNQGFPTVGMRVKGTGIPDGTRLIAVGSTTLTMSANATVTADTVQLEDAAINVVGVKGGQELSAPNHIWYYNDKFIGYSPSGTYIDGYAITAAGGYGLAHTASYKEINGNGSYTDGLSFLSGYARWGASTDVRSIFSTRYIHGGGSESLVFNNIADMQVYAPFILGGYHNASSIFNIKDTRGGPTTLEIENTQNDASGNIINASKTRLGSPPSAGDKIISIEANTNASIKLVGHGLGAYLVDFKYNAYDGSSYRDLLTILPDGKIYLPYITASASIADSVVYLNRSTGELQTRVAPSGSNPAAQISDSLNALRATLLFDVVHTVTTTNTTPVTIDTLSLAANTQATYHLTFHGFDNTGVLNDALWYERRVLIKYSDGAVPTPTVQVIGTDIAEGTLNAVPPPVTFVVSGTLVFIKVASSSTMNIPWQISRTLTDVSGITAH